MKAKTRFAKQATAALLCFLMLFTLFPSFGGVQVNAAALDGVYAAYKDATNASGTTLPTTTAGGEEITWDLAPIVYAATYDRVTVEGTTAGSGQVTAEVEVVPPSENPLVYFIDAGRLGGSKHEQNADRNSSIPDEESRSDIYNAVQQLTGNQLLNHKPDGTFGEHSNSWGHDYSQFNLRRSRLEGNPTSIEQLDGIQDKYQVGLRTNDSTIVYHFTLVPGKTYTLDTGHQEFWKGGWNRPRVADINLTYTVDSTPATTKIGLVDMRTPANTYDTTRATAVFTVPADADGLVTISFVRSSAVSDNEAPCISWLAIAEGELPPDPVFVTVNGDDVQTAAGNVNGLPFKGFGLLSGNSTSDLLMDYKAESPAEYQKLLQFLFGGEYPIMNHVKIEMGNDRNSSTGPESATKRSEEETANVLRNPSWQLAADAKAVNPDVKVSMLRWVAPAWANSADKLYQWYKETIVAAYETYGFMVDYINPNVNEHWGGSSDVANTIDYAARIQAETTETLGLDAEGLALYQQIKLVVSDQVSTVSNEVANYLKNDTDFFNAVDVVGYHYSPWDDSNGGMKWFAEVADKEVWNSEAQATFSNSAFRPANNVADPTVAGTGIGGGGSALEMAVTFLKGFHESRRTHIVYQPAIGAFYEGGQYSYKELLSARDPWSGWIHYDAGLAILQHVAKFATTGWENEANTAGIWRAIPSASYSGAVNTNPVNGRNGEPSYMTLAAPDSENFSTVIANDSEYRLTYKIQTANMNLAAGQQLAVWETRADDGGQFNDNYLKNVANVPLGNDGFYTVTVQPFSMVTVTTLAPAETEIFDLPVEGERTVLDTDSTGAVQDTSDNYLYADNFDYEGKQVPVMGAGGEYVGFESYIAARGGNEGAMARYTHTVNGAFEVYLDESGSNYVLRQQLDTYEYGLGGAWNGGDPVTMLGDMRWMNYQAAVDVMFEYEAGTPYAAVAIRQYGGTHNLSSAAYDLRLWVDGGWQLRRFGTVVADGNVVNGTGTQVEGFETGAFVWHNLALEGAGSTITASIDGVVVASYEDFNPQVAGRIALGSSHNFVRFDNLAVTKVNGFEPYYIEYLDNFETYDLGNPKGEKLVYNSQWSHEYAKGMYDYQRTHSYSRGEGATVGYTFTGTGIDLLGPNSSIAYLNVYVDGEQIANRAATQVAGSMRNFFSLRGLVYGQHEVVFEVASGSITLDAVGVVGNLATGEADLAALENALAYVADIVYDASYDSTDWQVFENSREVAMAAMAGSTLDGAGAARMAVLLRTAAENLEGGPIVALGSVLEAGFAGQENQLPTELEATFGDSSTGMVPVEWQDTTWAGFNTAWDTVAVNGRVRDINVVAYVEVVPESIVYFADVNAAAGLELGYNSPAYEAVKAKVEAAGYNLYNDKPDQPYNGSETYGHFSRTHPNNVNNKGVEGGAYSKIYTTGLHTSNSIGAELNYALTLPEGTYSFTVGAHDWWNNSSRRAYVYVENGDDSKVQIANINYGSGQKIFTGTFTVTDASKPTIVTLEAYNAAQSPLLSFVGVVDMNLYEPVLELPQLEYELYEPFSAEGLKLTGKRLGGDALDVTDLAAIVWENEFNSEVPGEYKFTISYLNFSETVTVTVLEPSVREIYIESPPVKTIYELGEGFDPTGLQVAGVMNNGEVVDVTADVSVEASAFDETTAGAYTINIVYQADSAITTSFSVLVQSENEQGPTHVELTAPGKLEYGYGEALDLDGMVLRMFHGADDETGVEITALATVSGYNAYKQGGQEITVSYLGFSATFTVYVHNRLTVESIAVSGAKTSFEYGEAFVRGEGFTVTATYSDNSTVEVTGAAVVDAGSYDAQMPGTYTIKVSFAGKETTYEVAVDEAPVVLNGIELAALPTKLEYKVGESFSPAGMEVVAVYSDNTRVPVVLEEVVVSGFVSAVANPSLQLTVSWGGKTAGFNVAILESPTPPDPGPGGGENPDKGYDITDGQNGSYNKGSANGLSITVDAPFSEFVTVKVNGTELTRGVHYTVAEGSTIVQLLPAYLDGLAPGSYTVEIVFEGGVVSATTFIVNEDGSVAPREESNGGTATGDASTLWLYLVLALAALAAMAAVVVVRKRRGKGE